MIICNFYCDVCKELKSSDIFFLMEAYTSMYKVLNKLPFNLVLNLTESAIVILVFIINWIEPLFLFSLICILNFQDLKKTGITDTMNEK